MHRLPVFLFNLQLMALGAPPELLLDTQRVTIDEIEHTQLAYCMVSAYEGRPVGPAPSNWVGCPSKQPRRRRCVVCSMRRVSVKF